MLLRFVASNFLSIADEIDFNMFPAPKLKTHKNHVYKTEQVDILKSAAIYGANGSGKSNLVIAMDYLKSIVVDGKIFDYGEAYFKLDKISKEKSTRLETEFRIGNKYFAYGIDD
ncbi:MAG: AAA family ATPase [Saprospiraceae bacterium]|nr:AAA family ATPase [Saprospiraceae bacterium]